MKKIILATNNQGKITELSALLSPIYCLSQYELGIESANETGLSFIENAIIKARHVSRITKCPALADDSGLVVKALHGQPGIYSARFAGVKATDTENIELLLKRLKNIKEDRRQAYFYCAIALVQSLDDPTPLIATGQIDGSITKAQQGVNGFGYDPVFYLHEHQCTMAQLNRDIKNTISHRAIALKQLKEQLNRLTQAMQ